MPPDPTAPARPAPRWDRDAAAVTQALQGLGIAAGHRIGVACATNGLHAALHAAARQLDLTLVPLDLRQPTAAWREPLDRCGVDLVLADEARADAATSAAGARPVLIGSRDGVQVAVAQAGTLPPVGPPEAVTAPGADPEGPPRGHRSRHARVVLATSGTTGEPRLVGITERHLAAHAEAAAARIQSGPDADWLCVLPLWHVGGVALVDRCLRSGAALRLLERFDAARVAASLRDGVTHVSLVPTMLWRLLKHWGDAPPPPRLRCVVLGGDAADEPRVQAALAAGWPVWCSYGLTEACSQVATASPPERREHPGTVGHPLAGVSVRVVDEAGHGVPAGQTGRILVAGPTVVGGGASEGGAPDAAGGRASGADGGAGGSMGRSGGRGAGGRADHGFDTGDLGRVDADGRLYVTGRAAARIVTGGETVDAAQVEAVLERHPAIREAAVVGLADPEWGQRVAAAVVPDGGRAVDEAALAAWCRDALSASAVPRVWRVVASLPRSATGKLRRAEAARLFDQATRPA